jgi:hypothetical protein
MFLKIIQHSHETETLKGVFHSYMKFVSFFKREHKLKLSDGKVLRNNWMQIVIKYKILIILKHRSFKLNQNFKFFMRCFLIKARYDYRKLLWTRKEQYVKRVANLRKNDMRLLMRQLIDFEGVRTDLCINSSVREIDPALTDTQQNVYHVVCWPTNES